MALGWVEEGPNLRAALTVPFFSALSASLRSAPIFPCFSKGPQDTGQYPEQLRQRVGAHLGERGGVDSVVAVSVRPGHPHPSGGYGDLDGRHEGDVDSLLWCDTAAVGRQGRAAAPNSGLVLFVPFPPSVVSAE